MRDRILVMSGNGTKLRLWGLMHRHITHNTCHTTFKQFREAVLTFLRDEVTDNFRIISPEDFRILA